MQLTPEAVNDLIRKRRAIFPKTYNGQPIAREIVEQVLENANWAPTHRNTEPWRFKVFMGGSLGKLAGYLADFYRANTPPDQFSEEKLARVQTNPLRAACAIAICMQRDPEGRVPEWEELAAVSCAVQNMWLTCTAYGIGCYWSTPPAALHANEFLGLAPGESCWGFFYMGQHDLPDLPGKRSPVTEKVQWI